MTFISSYEKERLDAIVVDTKNRVQNNEIA